MPDGSLEVQVTEFEGTEVIGTITFLDPKKFADLEVGSTPSGRNSSNELVVFWIRGVDYENLELEGEVLGPITL